MWLIPPIIHKPDWLIEEEKKEKERLLKADNRTLLLEILKRLERIEKRQIEQWVQLGIKRFNFLQKNEKNYLKRFLLVILKILLIKLSVGIV